MTLSVYLCECRYQPTMLDSTVFWRLLGKGVWSRRRGSFALDCQHRVEDWRDDGGTIAYRRRSLQ